jgi:AraC-like DNA-binding protein
MSFDLNFSTDCAPEAESFDAWREFSLGTFGVLIEPLMRGPAGFTANVKARLKGPLALFRYQTDGTHLVRGPSQIARRTWNGYMIHLERGVGARYANPLKEVRTRRGALGVGALDMPWEGWGEARFDHDVLIVPTALLEAYLPAKERPVFTTLTRPIGVDALAADYFESLMRQWEELDEASMEAAVGVLCRLIGVALGARADSAPEAVAAGRLAAAKRHVEACLADPRLNAASAAAAMRISERTLEGVFAQAGLSFAAYVRRRRLEQCREALLVDPTRLIADVAFAWGFNSLSSFYRAFVAEFGASPGYVRERREQFEAVIRVE